MYSLSLTVAAGVAARRTAVSLLVGAVAMALPIATAAQTLEPASPQTGLAGASTNQAQGTINGMVITPDGGPLPNTPIRARNLLTGEVSGSTTTGADGEYTLNVDPGNYVIEILDDTGLVIATSAFISAVAGVTLATAATVAATASALTAVSGVTGLAAVLGTTAARSATFAAAAAGVAGVVVPEEILVASPSNEAGRAAVPVPHRPLRFSRHSISRTLALIAVITAAAVCQPHLHAQTVPQPDAEATLRFGPLSMKSTISLSNLGWDSNVFNESDAAQQQSDFTMTLSPVTDLWLRMGRTWVSGTIGLDWVYYRTFASERAANSTYRIGVSRDVRRLALRVDATRLSTRARPGFEIDARSRRLEMLYEGEATFRVFSKTRFGAKAWQREVEFDQAAVFRGANLAEQLNRQNSGEAFLIRHDLTPLTSFSLEVGKERDRFVSSPFRNADSTRATATISLQPLALISGNASIGYRRFTPLTGDIPPFTGATAAVNLTYDVFGTTRLGVGVTQDVQPSFEVAQPYYVETGTSGSIQQQVYGSRAPLRAISADSPGSLMGVRPPLNASTSVVLVSTPTTS